MKVHVMMMSKYTGAVYFDKLVDIGGELVPLTDQLIKDVAIESQFIEEDEKDIPLSVMFGTEYDVSDYQRHYEGEESSVYFMAEE